MCMFIVYILHRHTSCIKIFKFWIVPPTAQAWTLPTQTMTVTIQTSCLRKLRWKIPSPLQDWKFCKYLVFFMMIFIFIFIRWSLSLSGNLHGDLHCWVLFCNHCQGAVAAWRSLSEGGKFSFVEIKIMPEKGELPNIHISRSRIRGIFSTSPSLWSVSSTSSCPQCR